MKTKKLLSLILVVAMVLISFAGCGTKEQSGTPEQPKAETPKEEIKADKILKMGGTGFSGVFNPISEGEYVPMLADWKLSDDKLTYTFTLKDGIKFSDGTPLTTEDVAFTYETIACPDYNGPRAYAVSSMKGYDEFHSGAKATFDAIKIIDGKTLSFTFADDKAAPANIECFIYGIMPKHYYKFDKWEDFLALNEKPLGSHVMTFDSYAPKQFIKLVKNQNYWDSANAAKIDGVLVSEVPDESILAALQTNQIDFAQIASSKDNLDAANALSNISVTNYLGNGYTYMCFNCTRPQLADVKVRQALMYALDRESFIDAQYGEGLAEVGMAPISPSSWAFPDASDLNPYKFDMEKAGQLMDFDTVVSRTMDPEPADKDFDIYTMGFVLNIDPDPTGALFDDDAYVAGGFNSSGYKNADAMELVKKGKAEFDMAKRAEIYKEWAAIMNEEIPHIIIAYRKELWGINTRVKGMDLGTYAKWTDVIKNISIE